MKKIRSVISLSFLVMFFVTFSFPSFCFSEQPDSKVWESFAKGRYYNKKNISKSVNIIKVWTYSIITNDVRKKRLENMKQHEELKKYQNYDHYTVLSNIDCQKKMTSLEKVIDYDNKGKVLNTIINKNSEWGFIAPGSEDEKLYNKLCVNPMKP
ncbi:MAG: surface-adhesin E family protein [Smithella sp.]